MLPETVAHKTRSPTFTSEMNFIDPDSRETLSEPAKHDFRVEKAEGEADVPSNMVYVILCTQLPEVPELTVETPEQSVLV